MRHLWPWRWPRSRLRVNGRYFPFMFRIVICIPSLQPSANIYLSPRNSLSPSTATPIKSWSRSLLIYSLNFKFPTYIIRTQFTKHSHYQKNKKKSWHHINTTGLASKNNYNSMIDSPLYDATPSPNLVSTCEYGSL